MKCYEMTDLDGKNYYTSLERVSSSQTIIIDEKQKKASRKYVDPHITDIIGSLTKCRENLDKQIFLERDKFLKHSRSRERPKAFTTIYDYPTGFCHLIVKHIFEAAWKTPSFRKLIKNGVALQWVFGVLDGKYFQNAMQLGEYYIDVANDTIDSRKEKIFYDKAKNVDFKPIKTQEQDGIIEERYHKFEVVPNYYIPALSLFYHSFLINKQDRVVMLKKTSESIIINDLKSGLSSAKHFYHNSKFSKNRLPTDIKKKLEKIVEKSIPKVDKRLREVLTFKDRQNDDMFNFAESIYKKIDSREAGDCFRFWAAYTIYKTLEKEAGIVDDAFSFRY